jgi:hypothetical protein
MYLPTDEQHLGSVIAEQAQGCPSSALSQTAETSRDCLTRECEMGRNFGAVVLVVVTLFFLLTTISASLNPERFGERLGLRIINAGGVNEIMAQYAGFFLAAAGVCIAALADWLPRSTAFVTVAAVFGGLIVGRLISLVLNGGFGGFGPTIQALYVIDAIGFVLAIGATSLEWTRPGL